MIMMIDLNRQLSLSSPLELLTYLYALMSSVITFRKLKADYPKKIEVLNVFIATLALLTMIVLRLLEQHIITVFFSPLFYLFVIIYSGLRFNQILKVFIFSKDCGLKYLTAH